MSFLITHVDNHTVQTICDSIREKILDIVQDFDYTVFKHFKPEDQTSINQINVDVKNDVLTLSRLLTFDYVQHNDLYLHRSQGQYQIRKIYIDFKIKVLPKSGKVTSVTIDYSMDGSRGPSDIVFGLYVGDTKYLINNTFYDIESFEGMVFQQLTVDKADPFGLDYVLEIIQKLKV